MTLKDAFIHFINSDAFKDIAKEPITGSTYRVYKHRFDNDKLTETKMKKMLLEHGYTIKEVFVSPPKRNKKTGK